MSLCTRWADDVDPSCPLPEYPRPQLVRDAWLNLNGRWDYAINEGATPTAWDGEIVVPFSPETELSGAVRSVGPEDVLWYRRSVSLTDLPAITSESRWLLHFGAVDQTATVLVDDVEVGSHIGGYLPFACDVTAAIEAARAARRDHVEIVVRVTDDTDASWHTRGKQRRKRGGIWYTPQSGIWQTVWLEPVAANGVDALVLEPRYDELTGWSVVVTVDSLSPTAEVSISATTVTVRCGEPTAIPIESPRTWSPQDPYLYDVIVGCDGEEVRSYVGLRRIELGAGLDGHARLLLNGEAVFQVGVLDQGYWPEGGYTAPTDEALRYDVEAARELGFTMIRKHIKVEPMRWYHHCDRLGVLVWQDMPNGGTAYKTRVITAPAFLPYRIPDSRYRSFGRESLAGRMEFLAELDEMIEHLRSVPSIVAWVPFNEGWGQFDANATAARVRTMDPSRVVDHASGWHDQGGGDMQSSHVYFRRYRVPRRRDHRALVLSEYGGYNLAVAGHRWGSRNFGYRRQSSAAKLLARFRRLHQQEIAPAMPQGLCAIVYTQLTDVEDELNGLLTYDREHKLDPDDVRRVLSALWPE